MALSALWSLSAKTFTLRHSLAYLGPSEDEVTFHDLKHSKQESKVGFAKIRACSERARKDGLQYLWVDTCCINKKSSAELSEAINSMYAWYREADSCYAYLSDVNEKHRFYRSRWFRRGWTLQEMLAPADVLSFDASWTPIGFKSSLASTISRHTGIDKKALLDGTTLNTFSIAERMSWAAKRQTTRVEDKAYCLLGIFDVNMSLIYGEGHKAFIRLQGRLLKAFDDASMLAYVSLQPSLKSGPTTNHSSVDRVHPDHDVGGFETDEEQIAGTVGLYASSPTYFSGAAKYIPYPLMSKLLSHRESEGVLGMRIRRSGHLVKLQVALWENFLRLLSEKSEMSNLMVQSAVQEMLGIRLAVLSIQKLRKCVQSARMVDWKIAFLDCRRRNGGIVGILLQETTQRGIYTRQRFPSLIETEQVESYYTYPALQIRTIYVEAGSLRTDLTNQTHPTLLQATSENGPCRETVLRATNLHDYGLPQQFLGSGTVLSDETVSWHTKGLNLPAIVLTVHRGHCDSLDFTTQGDKEGVICTLHTNLPGREHLDRYGNVNFSDEDPLEMTFIPTRGFAGSMRLNADLQLVLESKMQWKRENALHHVDRLKRQCLLTLSITRIAEGTGRESLLEDREL
ncbi:hypothetical protein M3J09_004958 [Ascochyta lentis]